MLFSYLFFTDDSFVFFKANDMEFHHVRMSLEFYARASGQVINFDKSEVSFGKSIPKVIGEALALSLGYASPKGMNATLGLRYPWKGGRNRSFNTSGIVCGQKFEVGRTLSSPRRGKK